MSKGRRHFGSVRKLPSGRFQASYWHEGLRHQAEATFTTKGDALVWLSTTEADIHRGAWVDPRGGEMTLDEVAAKWLQSNPSKRPNTWAMDEIVIRVHLKPIGSRKLRSVTQPDVQALVNSWSASAAPRTVKRRYGVLAAIFAYAVAADWLTRSPCRNIKLPLPTTTRRRQLDPDQVAALAEAMDPRYRPRSGSGPCSGGVGRR